MFGGAEYTHSNLDEQNQRRLVATLTTFSAVVRDSCMRLGLGAGRIPFCRPANFLAVLNSDAIHLAVDDVVVGAMPEHWYQDRRSNGIVLPLDAIVAAAVRECGFRDPIGVSLPIAAFTDDDAQRKQVLAPVALGLCLQLRERVMVQSMNLPAGYEHFAHSCPLFFRIIRTSTGTPSS